MGRIEQQQKSLNLEHTWHACLIVVVESVTTGHPTIVSTTYDTLYYAHIHTYIHLPGTRTCAAPGYIIITTNYMLENSMDSKTRSWVFGSRLCIAQQDQKVYRPRDLMLKTIKEKEKSEKRRRN